MYIVKDDLTLHQGQLLQNDRKLKLWFSRQALMLQNSGNEVSYVLGEEERIIYLCNHTVHGMHRND